MTYATYPATPDERHSRSASWWGMALLVLTEAVFFASIIAGYHYLRLAAPAWPPAGVERPELLIPIINTLLLVGSSVAFIWGERGLKNGDPGRARIGLALAVALGVIFLGLQIYEYTRTTLDATASTYGALFFAVTGLHGLHVLVGLIMLTTALIWALLGSFNPRRHAVVTNVGLYWHFVDAVWLILVFPSVYLSPYL